MRFEHTTNNKTGRMVMETSYQWLNNFLKLLFYGLRKCFGSVTLVKPVTVLVFYCSSQSAEINRQTVLVSVQINYTTLLNAKVLLCYNFLLSLIENKLKFYMKMFLSVCVFTFYLFEHFILPIINALISQD